MTRAEVIIRNLQELIEKYKQMQEDVEQGEDPYEYHEGEYGNDLTWQIDCHPIFKGDKPCLLDERHVEMDKQGLYQAHCRECKARWLMEEYDE